MELPFLEQFFLYCMNLVQVWTRPTAAIGTVIYIISNCPNDVGDSQFQKGYTSRPWWRSSLRSIN